MVIQIFDFNLNLLGEIPIYRSLQMARSYGGIGRFELHSHPQAPNVELIKEDCIAIPSGQPHKAFLIEDIETTYDKLVIRGCQLKGLAKRRVCVPPLNLPRKLWKYTQGAWLEITDAAQIKELISEDILQGYEKPAAVTEGLLWLDMKDLASVYNWESKAQTGEVWLDLETAQTRSKYKNFGYDRYTGAAESALKHFVKNNMVDAEDDKRNIEGLVLEADRARGMVLPWQARFDKLEELLGDITETTGIGWDIEADIEHKQMVFKAIEGQNLADDQGTERITISLEMGNADDVRLVQQSNAHSNIAYTGGVGEGEERMILAVAEGELLSGAQRREAWTEAGGNEDIELLRMSGLKALKDKGRKISITAEVLDGGAVEYETDWNVGDIVKVQFEAGTIKAEMDARVIEVKEVIEVDKPRKLQVTFGDAPVTINSMVKAYSRVLVR